MPDYEKKEDNAIRRQEKALKKVAKGKGKAKTPTADDEYDPEGPDWDAENDVDEGYEENKAATEAISVRVLNPFIHEEHEPSAELRVKWLAKLGDWSKEQVFESLHVAAMVDMLYNLIKKRLGDKIIVFSQYLRYLDIINKGLRVRHKVECLRFDGTVLPKLLEDLQWQILLITAGCGSVGLNLTAGNIAVLCGEWWNVSNERQAMCRAFRQGQKKIVMVIRPFVVNSAIDREIVKRRMARLDVNNDFTKALMHNHCFTISFLRMAHAWSYVVGIGLGFVRVALRLIAAASSTASWTQGSQTLMGTFPPESSSFSRVLFIRKPALKPMSRPIRSPSAKAVLHKVTIVESISSYFASTSL